MKIAIIGGTGLLGSNLVKLYKNFDVRAFSRSKALNINDEKNCIINFDLIDEELEKVFDSWTPDLIINCVALVNLELCEKNYALAYKINCEYVEKLAIIAKKYSSYFIHISTDHYFNDKIKFHSENYETILVNNYAKTKFQGEIKALENNKNTLVVRTNIIGFRNNERESFFEWLLNSLIEQKEINLFTNYFTSPLSVNYLGKILLECYSEKLEGIYNISSREVIDKYNFGKKVAERFNLSSKKITPIILTNQKIERALTLGLDTSKIEKKLGHKLTTIDNTIESLYEEYNNKDKK